MSTCLVNNTRDDGRAADPRGTKPAPNGIDVPGQCTREFGQLGGSARPAIKQVAFKTKASIEPWLIDEQSDDSDKLLPADPAEPHPQADVATQKLPSDAAV